MKTEFQFSIVPPQFGSAEEARIAPKLSPLNIQYLQAIAAQSLNDLIAIEQIIDNDEREKRRRFVIGELNVIAHLINTSNEIEV